jgi:Resolvase, N terminal domain
MSQDMSGEMLGIQRQLDECTALADGKGWEITQRFDDNDLSAFSGKTRPGVEAMLDAGPGDDAAPAVPVGAELGRGHHRPAGADA